LLLFSRCLSYGRGPVLPLLPWYTETGTFCIFPRLDWVPMLAATPQELPMRHLLQYASCLIAIACAAPLAHAAPAKELAVQIGYLSYRPDPGPLLSNVIPEPADAGQRGAELAIADSNTTGRFLKHSYQLKPHSSDSPEQLLEEARKLHAEGLRLFVINAPADSLQAL